MKNYQTARGTQDILPKDTRKWNQVEDVIKQICHVYGYDEIRTPIFEDTSVFKRENDSSDMVNKEMYSFSMNQKDSLTLRPEGTAGVVRSFVQNKNYANADLPYKVFYKGEMFRYERPQKGRYRQFNQFGVENIGVKSPYIDAECIALGYSVVKSMGLNCVKVLINTLGDAQSRIDYREVLVEYFKEHLDGLCGDCQRRFVQNPLRLLDCKVDKESEIMKNAPSLQDSLSVESKQYFDQVLQALDNLQIPYEIDDRLVRGLDYYTDTVFEVVSTHSETGSQSAVFAGGRYDGLVEYFGGPQMSGVGFAMGLERLLLLAQAEGIQLDEDDSFDVYVMGLGEVNDVPFNLATMCRSAGYKTEFNPTTRSLKAQFKTVDRKNCKAVIIVGESELANNQVNIKFIETQKQVCVDIDKIVEVLDAQFEEKEHGHEHGEKCECGSCNKEND